MVYISDPEEKLQDLLKHTGCSFAKFAELNPEFCVKYPNYNTTLPPYSPLFLKEPFDPDTRAEVATTLLQFHQEVRRKLKQMQACGVDFPTTVAVTGMMEQLQAYAKSFRQGLNNPLINTPWTSFNDCLTNEDLFTMTSEGLKYGSKRMMSRFVVLNQFYEDMLARDILNRQLYMLMQQKDRSKAIINNLEKQIKQLTAEIKGQLPKKLNTILSPYVSKKFTPDEMRKMRANCYSVKAAKAGELITTHLDVLNKLGLVKMKKIVEGAKTLGNRVDKVGTLVSYGAVAYDTQEAMMTSGSKAAAKTFITGAGAIFLTDLAVSACGGISAVGGFVIESLVAGTSATLLINNPVGWVIIVGAGAAAAGTMFNTTQGGLERIWDLGEVYVSQASSLIEEGSKNIYHFSQEAAHAAHKIIEEMWSLEPQWVLDFYNGKASE